MVFEQVFNLIFYIKTLIIFNKNINFIYLIHIVLDIKLINGKNAKLFKHFTEYI